MKKNISLSLLEELSIGSARPYHHIGPDIYMKGQQHLWLHMGVQYEMLYDERNLVLSWLFAIHLKDEKL